MSAIVDKAIAEVTKAVKRLEKGERNTHGNYAFSSIDDFLEMTGQLCGAAGLNVIMDEADFEILPDFFTTSRGKTPGLRMKFAIALSKDGETKGPYHRSIVVPSTLGSQAFGAGQSYVLKQFLRATFQIPTGDKAEDIDSHDTGTMTVPTITAEQAAELRTLLGKASADEPAFCTYLKVDSLEALAATRFAKAEKALNDRIANLTKQEANRGPENA